MRPAPAGARARRPSGFGMAVPLLAALAVVSLVAVLGSVVQLDHARVPKPDFRAHLLPGYPDASPPGDAAGVVEALLWWLCLSVVSWVAGIVAAGVCVLQLWRCTAHRPALRRRVLGLFAAVLLLAAAGLGWSVVAGDLALMPIRPLVAILDVVGAGLPRLAALNTALVFVVALALVSTSCLLLAPAACAGAAARQMRAIVLLMYVAAGFLLVWMSTAAAMYRAAASLLVPALRTAVLSAAPTASLMAGLFLSLLLAAVYGAAVAWLQRCHEEELGGAPAAAPGADTGSPLALLAAHWPKVVGVLLPALPGIAGTVLQALTQAH